MVRHFTATGTCTEKILKQLVELINNLDIREIDLKNW